MIPLTLLMLGLNIFLASQPAFSSSSIIKSSGTGQNVRHFSIERYTTNQAEETVVLWVNASHSLNTLGSHFVGMTIDIGILSRNWGTLDFSVPKVQNMARALTPSYLRFGGTAADSTIYRLSDKQLEISNSSTLMTAFQWDALNQFARDTGLELIMDLNVLLRHQNGSWDPSNTMELLKYSTAKNYLIPGFELGNEYDIFENKFNTSLSPQQFAKDVAQLRSVLSGFPMYADSFIVGPETASDHPQYFQSFLQAGGAKVVRAASFHQYYFAGAKRNLSYFTDLTIMNELFHTLDTVKAQARTVDPQMPLWLSETSSAYNGGASGMSDRFAAGFLWLDKLGVCAYKGVETVIRQDFYGGNYALIDGDLNPNPDFWLTLLYKGTVRGAVFNVTSNNSRVRAYAACANMDNFKNGSLVVYLLNTNSFGVVIDIPGFSTRQGLMFALTAGDSDGLLSKFVALNGEKLELVNDSIPELAPKPLPEGPVFVAPYSYNFLVYPYANVLACM